MKIHGHPQKTHYADDGSDWPTHSSQGHWRPGSGMPRTLPVIPIGFSAFDPQTAHTHLDLTFPIYGEIAGPITIQATLKLFHTAGHVGYIGSPMMNIRDIVYADTGTSTPPDLTGDPMGVKQWNFSCVFDPTMVRLNTFPQTANVPAHGWGQIQVAVKTFYDNGDNMLLTAIRSIYSMIDPTQPEWGWSGTGPTNGTAVTPNTGRGPHIGEAIAQLGDVFATYDGLLPLAPIHEPWPTRGFFYAYEQLQIPGGAGAFQFPNGTLALRQDANFHAGIPGTDLMPEQSFLGFTQTVDTPITFDPAQFTPGPHTVAAFWQEPDGEGNDATAVYVIPLTVGAGGPPPHPPATVFAPAVVGLTQMAATMAVMGVGLALGTVTAITDPAASGTVLTQVPAAGTIVALGSAVTLTVSSGPVITSPPAGDVWVVMKTPPIFMQLVTNGVPQDRFRICDPTEPMADPTHCPEIVTKQ